MKIRRFAGVLLSISIAAVIALSGCRNNEGVPSLSDEAGSAASTSFSQTVSKETEALALTSSDETEIAETDETEGSAIFETAPPVTAATKPAEATASEEVTEKPFVEKNGSYTTPEDVAEYIHTFGTLPNNFITKSEAKALGWDNSKGNLWEVAEGKSIGGDRFGNYEGLLPRSEGRKYTECDVNYSGGYRTGERIVFSNDGLIFYTDDHYKTFTQLY